MYIVAVLRDRLYCRVERSVLTVINEYMLVINTNLPPILHCFQVMADYMSNFASDRGSLYFNALAGGDSLRTIYR